MSILEITIQRRIQGGWPVVSDYQEPGQLPTRREGILRLEDDWEDRLYGQELNPREYGSTLGQALFRDRIRDLFMQARRSSQDDLRVLLLVEDQELRTLRWGWLCAPIRLDGQFDLLALDQQVLFSLYLPSPTDRHFPPITRRDLKALVLVADPPPGNRYGLAPFDASQTVASLEAALSEIPHDILSTVEGAVGLPTLDQLTSHLTLQPYTLLHIVAHGRFLEATGETTIYLLDDDKEVSPVATSEFLQQLDRLKAPKGLPQLTFLATCQSADPRAEAVGALGGLAQRLVQLLGMPAVVAMTQRVSLPTVQALARTFYAQLWKHGEPDRALVQATTGLAGTGDEVVSALYSRLGGRRLFEIDVREPSRADYEHALNVLEELLPERAPVLVDGFPAQAQRLRHLLERSAEQQDGAEWDALTAEINTISQDISGRSFRGLALGQKPTEYDANCPFPGLLAFQAQDQAYFFSREELIAALEDRLREHNFLALLGPSASGKSSLVQAGLLPALKQWEPDLQVACLKPGSDPPARLTADLEGVQDGSQLLVVDQFEELFTECPDEQMRRTFLDHLFDLVNKMRVVIVMRADYWGDCAPYRDLVEKMQAHQALVPPMNEAQLRNAIERQRGAVGLRFEADLANTMLDDVRGEPGAMPLLQHALRELWQRRHGIWLKASEYRAIGKAQGAIAKSARDLHDKLSPEEQNRVRDIFVRLTRLDDDVAPGADWRDSRRRATTEDLVPAGSDPKDTETLVNRLATAQLVVVSTDPATRKAEVEVSHEALIRHWSLLSRWLEKDRQTLQLREGIRRSALEWEQDGRNDDDLLHRGERLGRAQTLAKHPNYPLNERELTYLQSCTLLRAEGTLQGVRSAVRRCEPADPWLDQLREEGGQALIRGLEEPVAGTSAHLEKASTPSRVEALLGLDGDILPRQPEQESAAFGPMAWSAVSHDKAVTRQTAALALTLPYGVAALDRLEAALAVWAQQTQIGSWQRRRLRSELRGSLAEIDAEIESLNAGLPRLDRLGAWLWRVRRRVIAGRHRIFALVVGAAIAAGLVLGSYRGLLGVFAGPLFMTRFATSFFWGVILGAAVGLGIGLAKPMALEPRTAQGEAPPIWRTLWHPERRSAVLAAILGTLLFGLANVVVSWFNGLPVGERALVIATGLLAGLGVNLGLYGQPETGRQRGIGTVLLRLGAAAGFPALAQWVLIVVEKPWAATAVTRTGTQIARFFGRYDGLYQFIERNPNAFSYLDAAIVGILLTIGITIGLHKAVEQQTRWQALVGRSGEQKGG